MADDVQPQQEGMKTLHLRLLRIQWQVVTLQLISTIALLWICLLYTSPSPRDVEESRMPSSA